MVNLSNDKSRRIQVLRGVAILAVVMIASLLVGCIQYYTVL